MEKKTKKKTGNVRKVAGCLKDAEDVKQAKEILSLRDEEDREVEPIEEKALKQ